MPKLINEQATQIVEDILSDNGASLKEHIGKALNERALDAIEARKVKVAKIFFGKLDETSLREVSNDKLRAYEDKVNTPEHRRSKHKRKYASLASRKIEDNGGVRVRGTDHPGESSKPSIPMKRYQKK